jgi:DNA-binding response OmpR family regulator
MNRILVVEPDPGITHLLIRDLTYRGFNIVHANNGEQAFEKMHAFEPDLTVIDAKLPDIDGIELCYRLRHMGNVLFPILLVSSSDRVADKVKGLESGADDYITRPFDFEEFAARIRARLRRVERTCASTRRVEVADLVLDSKERKVWRNSEPIALSAREYDLLEVLMQNAGHVLTKEYIFERVWGLDSEAGWEVVKVYVNYVRAKLNGGGRPNLIHAVRGVGYILRP